MTTTNTNGRVPRKSLASQIDRLDTILDDLSTGLNEAVTAAVREAVILAVQSAVRAVLTDDDLRNRLKPNPVAIPVRPSFAARLWWHLVSAAKCCWNQTASLVNHVRAQVKPSLKQLRDSGAQTIRSVKRGMSSFGRRLWFGILTLLVLLARFRKPLIVALGVGVSIGLGCYLAGPLVSSFTSGLGGFVGSLLACTLARLRQMLSRLELLDG